jgi:hypothetical protein
MSLESSYNGEWSILVTNTSNAPLDVLQNSHGAFNGNGKLGFLSSFTDIDVQKCYYSIDFDFDDFGKYKTNVIEAFNPQCVRLFNQTYDSNISVDFVSTDLNMYNGIVTSEFNFNNTSTSEVINVKVDSYCVRHMPFCTVQTITLTPEQDMNLDMYHFISCKNNIEQVEYNNNTIISELVDPTKGLYVLNGKGVIKNYGRQLTISSAYHFENSNFTPIGFNTYRQEPNTCFQKIRCIDMLANQEYKLHIVSCTMSEYDFVLPLEETKRVLLSSLLTTNPITKLRQNHVISLMNMWKANITIDPKSGITQEEDDMMNKLKKTIKVSLYNIWASVRDGISTEINPSALSILDSTGSVFWDGDLWLIPVLCMFKPTIAKSILESRYNIIDKAMKLAAGYGYKGSKYPYVQDIIGYKNIYYDVAEPLHIFNTGLLNISIWNYYRCTMDRDWLRNKGYTMLKNNADFFASIVEIDNNGLYNINKVYSFHPKVANNNALTNYIAKLAIKYALEASYELGIIPNENWSRTYFNLDMRYFADPFEVIKLDEDATDTDTYRYLEHLIPITNFYKDMFFMTGNGRDAGTIYRNINFYQDKVNPSYETHPMNNMIRAMLYSFLSSQDPDSFTENMTTYVEKVLNENTSNLWGNFSMDNSQNTLNDITLSAMFILLIANSIGTVRIQGGVAETRFYYEEMKVSAQSTTFMPKTWKNMRVTGVGPYLDVYNILNGTYYS